MKSWISYPLLFGLGFAVWPLFVPPKSSSGRDQLATKSRTAKATSARPGSTFTRGSSSDYADAWKEVRDDPQATRKKFLLAWCEVDFESALRAHLKTDHEHWWLRSIPAPLVARHSDWLLAMLRQGEFGLRSQALLDLLVRVQDSLNAETRWNLVEFANEKAQRYLLKGLLKNSGDRDAYLERASHLGTPQARRAARYAYVY
jgi:hypothetical protein